MDVAIHLYAWARERFPLSGGFFIAVLFVTAVFYSQFLHHNEALLLTAGDIAGFIACWSVFLMLRVFDEHKDYALDLQNYPDRVLQSGRINLGHLKVLGLLAIVMQAGYSMMLDQGFGSVTYYWLALFSWSLLMAVEFFVPQWLNRHLTIYGASHMLIMPFIVGWLMQIGSAGSDLTNDTWWLVLMAFFAGCSYELTRKAWGEDEERDSIASYARQFGTRGVAILIAATLAATMAASIGMLEVIQPSTAEWFWYLAPVISWLLTVVVLAGYARRPTIKARKKNEAMIGLAMLIAYVTPLLAMVNSRGVAWIL
jgi:hypothetical protein